MMMGEFDHHHGSIVEDWISPSSSPIFFSPVLNDDVLIENIDSNREDLNNGADDLPKTRRGRGGLAARAGFNALRLNTESMRPSDLSISQVVRSPYLTIPPGLSPTTLLESPVFLSNSLVQPSPTTGKFLFAPTGSNNKNCSFGSDNNKDQFFEDSGSQPFSFKPVADPGSAVFDGDENSPENGTAPHVPQFSNSMMPETSSIGAASGGAKEDGDVEEVRNGEDDGYNWRKYGQKQVKGSEYPRSYYKCTHPNCWVKKKVERSHEGIITEIIYKGSHNHPEPVVTVPARRSAVGSDDQNSMQSVRDGDSPWSTAQNGGGPDNLEVNNNSLQAQKGAPLLDSSIAVDGSSTFSTNDEDEDDQQEESETSKRRKVEAYASELTGPTRAIREPRVVVQTTSEVDILDDGYRWRKYGQKVVKGNPNPRSYYKCTSPSCTVRKHVERASHDLRSVITTYEGKHNHDVPAARNSSHLNNSATSSTAGGSLHHHHHLLHRTEYPLVQNEMSRFDNRPAAAAAASTHLGSYGGYGYGMNQTTGIGSLGGGGMGNNSQGVAAAAAAAYMGGRQNQMGLMMMMPKGEVPKLEPININNNNNNNNNNNIDNNGSSVYHQIMNRLPQM